MGNLVEYDRNSFSVKIRVTWSVSASFPVAEERQLGVNRTNGGKSLKEKKQLKRKNAFYNRPSGFHLWKQTLLLCLSQRGIEIDWKYPVTAVRWNNPHRNTSHLLVEPLQTLLQGCFAMPGLSIWKLQKSYCSKIWKVCKLNGSISSLTGCVSVTLLQNKNDNSKFPQSAIVICRCFACWCADWRLVPCQFRCYLFIYFFNLLN